jgi:hypothetical protein
MTGTVTAGLNFGYNSNVTKSETFTTFNYYVYVFNVAGLPRWRYSNDDHDNTWMGSSNMPAEASLILFGATARNPSPLTVYFGSGAHHRKHGGYQLLAGKMVFTVDWQNARITFPPGANVTVMPGLPWAANSKGNLMNQIASHASDPTVVQAIADKAAWYTVSVPSVNDGTSATGNGSMTFDMFIVKAEDGSTYLRVKTKGVALGFSDDEEQQFIDFGVLPGDQSGVQLFTPADEHQPPTWNDAAAAQLDAQPDTGINYPEDGYAPAQTRNKTGTFSKTTSAGWSVGGNVGGSASSGDGGGASGGGAAGGGDAGAGDAAAGAVVA